MRRRGLPCVSGAGSYAGVAGKAATAVRRLASGEVDPGAVGSREGDGLGEIEARVAQLEPPEVDPVEIRPAQVGAAQAATIQVGAGQVGLAQVGALQVAAVEVGLGESHAPQLLPGQILIAQVIVLSNCPPP